MMSAKEMFKELGYEKAEKSESVVLYTNGYGDTISFKETKHVVITPIQGCRTIIMTCLLENAIHKQCEELGWIAEKQETNLEHYFDDLLKAGSRFTFMNEKIENCDSVMCSKCSFCGDCGVKRFKWLASQYKKPTYKLTKFEFDLIQTYRNCHESCKLSEFKQLIELKDKGYFKDINLDLTIHKILDNCEVVG